MKKFYFAVAVFALLGSVAFAKSDLQLQLGYRRIVTDQHITEMGLLETEDGPVDKYESNAFDFSLENFNLFNVKGDFFSVGFAETVAGYIGGIDKVQSCVLTSFGGATQSSDFNKTFVADFNFVIGPAVGFNFGNFIKLQAMVGFALEYAKYSYSIKNFSGVDALTVTTDNFALGFGTSVQAKFFPKSFISPVVGFRYVYTNANKMGMQWIVETNGESHELYDPPLENKGKVNNNSFIVYLGVTMNF